MVIFEKMDCLNEMKKITLFLTLAAIPFLPISCSSDGEGETGGTQFYDVSYGTHQAQKLDVVLPATATVGNEAPAIVFIHGGAWMVGDKSDFGWVKEGINGLGYAYVSINYRMIGDNATYVDMLADIASAISHLKENSKKYRIKTNGLAVWGASAGAHLALLYAYSKQGAIPVSFVVSQVGPTDFCDAGLYGTQVMDMLWLVNKLTGTAVTEAQLQNPSFLPPQAWQLASPFYYVNSSTTPTLMGYGVLDILVAYSNALRLATKLAEQNVPHQLITYPNSGHELENDEDKQHDFSQALAAYLQQYLPVAGK